MSPKLQRRRPIPSGYCTVRVMIAGVTYHILSAVLSPCAHKLILGWDFLSSTSAIISCRQPAIDISGTEDFIVSASTESVTLTADCVIPASCEHILPISAGAITGGDVLVMPSARLLSRGITVAPGLVLFTQGTALITVQNTTPQPILRSKGCTIGSVNDEIDAVLPPAVTPQCPPNSVSASPTPPLGAVISPDLTPSQKKSLLDVLSKYQASFDSYSPSLSQTSTTEHCIETDGPDIVRRRPYRVSPSERKIIDDNVADMLKRKLIPPRQARGLHLSSWWRRRMAQCASALITGR